MAERFTLSLTQTGACSARREPLVLNPGQELGSGVAFMLFTIGGNRYPGTPAGTNNVTYLNYPTQVAAGYTTLKAAGYASEAGAAAALESERITNIVTLELGKFCKVAYNTELDGNSFIVSLLGNDCASSVDGFVTMTLTASSGLNITHTLTDPNNLVLLRNFSPSTYRVAAKEQLGGCPIINTSNVKFEGEIGTPEQYLMTVDSQDNGDVKFTFNWFYDDPSFPPDKLAGTPYIYLFKYSDGPGTYVTESVARIPVLVGSDGYIKNGQEVTMASGTVEPGQYYVVFVNPMIDSIDDRALRVITVREQSVSATLDVRQTATQVMLTATSTTPGLGDTVVDFVYYRSGRPVAGITGRTLPDGGSVSATLNIGGLGYIPGDVFEVKVLDNKDNTIVYAEGHFTIPFFDTKVFDKWLKNGEAYDFSTPVTENFTLVGSWKEVYLVEFVDYDGKSLGSTRVTENDVGGLQLPDNPSRPGYTFAGWQTSLDGSIWDESRTVFSSMTLTATYTEA